MISPSDSPVFLASLPICTTYSHIWTVRAFVRLRPWELEARQTSRFTWATSPPRTIFEKNVN